MFQDLTLAVLKLLRILSRPGKRRRILTKAIAALPVHVHNQDVSFSSQHCALNFRPPSR